MRSLRRLAITPFETAVAALLAISGVSQLARWGLADQLLAVLPYWEAAIFSGVSITAGLLTSGALAAGARRSEMAGLLLICGVVASRFLLFGALFGYGSPFWATGVFYLAVLWAAAVRLLMIRRGDTLIRVRDGGHDLSG